MLRIRFNITNYDRTLEVAMVDDNNSCMTGFEDGAGTIKDLKEKDRVVPFFTCRAGSVDLQDLADHLFHLGFKPKHVASSDAKTKRMRDVLVRFLEEWV